MTWRLPLTGTPGDKPPKNSAELAMTVRPFLWQLRDAVNQLLMQKHWYARDATVGVGNTGVGAWEVWNAALNLNCSVDARNVYLCVFNGSAEYTMGGVGASWQIYDATAAAQIARKEVVVHGMPFTDVTTLVGIFIPAATGIHTLQVRALSGNAINRPANAEGLFMVLQAPFGD